MAEFQVQKDRFVESRIVDTDDTKQLDAGEVRISVERFGFSSNNITYAVVGHRIGYWQFFPASGEDADGWGVIPAWGFGVVTESRSNDIPVGERIFGYFPTASTLIATPTRVAATTFVDGAAHRADLPAGYNIYRRVTREPGYEPALDNQRMLLWPLLITSFCLWDLLQAKDWYGARRLVIVSASSKTAIGLAYAAYSDADAPETVGLTSPRNLEFVRNLPPYDAAVTYDELGDIDGDVPTVIVDMAGNAEFLGRLYKHLGENMNYCIQVGLTHWEKTAATDVDLRQRSEIFFAPDRISARMKDWGPDGFAARSGKYVASTTRQCSEWLQIARLAGLEGLADVYRDVCDGKLAPELGLTIRM